MDLKTTRLLTSAIIIFITVAGLSTLYGFIKKPSYSFEAGDIMNIAHRGASGYAPENTMSAFRKGVDHGADYIEGDVHLSKDNQLIIIHDEKVDRTTNGKGYVKDFTLTELKQLDAGVKFDLAYAGEQIITLDELMGEFHHEIGIIIDMKSPHMYPGIEKKIANVVNQYPSSDVIIQSDDFESVKKIHELLPDIPVAVLVSKSQHPLSNRQLDDVLSYATYINYNVKYLNSRVVAKIHKRDRKVMAWTIRERRSMKKAINLGVDGIITDFTDWINDDITYVAK